nr:immunoglobulin heavy chain junction region [Mus musculus]
CARVRGGFAYW